MKTFTKAEIDKILENHLHWVHEDCEGWENMRADLSDTDLSSVDLSYVDLRGANLHGTNLHDADLSYVDLRGADLHDADLSYVNLRGANLHGTNLHDADLSYVNLRGADLSYVNLRGADLHDADLSYVNLRGADLSYVDLRGANLIAANLYGANFSRAKNVPFIPMTCPDTGSFTGWKKVLAFSSEDLDALREVVIELEIPADAKRSSATTRKCRCDKAVVKSIRSIDGSESFDTAFSRFDHDFIYKVGEEVSVHNFDENRFNECAPGIHFFINRQEAVEY